MRNKDLHGRTIEELFKAKESFHRELAKIPFEEKIKILVQLQTISSEIRPSPKREKRVWSIDLSNL